MKRNIAIELYRILLMLAVYLLHGCGADFVFVRWMLGRFANPYLAALVTIPVVFVVCVIVDVMRRKVVAGVTRVFIR